MTLCSLVWMEYKHTETRQQFGSYQVLDQYRTCDGWHWQRARAKLVDKPALFSFEQLAGLVLLVELLVVVVVVVLVESWCLLTQEKLALDSRNTNLCTFVHVTSK